MRSHKDPEMSDLCRYNVPECVWVFFYFVRISFILPCFDNIWINVLYWLYWIFGCFKLQLIEHARRRSIICDHRRPLLKALRLDHTDIFIFLRSIQWRHHERDGVSNHRRLDCLLSRLLRAQIKQSIKARRHWPPWGESTGDRCIPSQEASNGKNVSIWWRHHDAFMALWYRFVFSKIFSEGLPRLHTWPRSQLAKTETVDWSWSHGNTSQ